MTLKEIEENWGDVEIGNQWLLEKIEKLVEEAYKAGFWDRLKSKSGSSDPAEIENIAWQQAKSKFI